MLDSEEPRRRKAQGGLRSAIKCTGIVLAALAGPFLIAQDKGGVKEPQFTEYPAPPLAPGKSADPKFATPGQRIFRTVIRDWTKKGPNLAGHFTIAEWGCGTGCEQIAIVDNQSGVSTKARLEASLVGPCAWAPMSKRTRPAPSTVGTVRYSP